MKVKITKEYISIDGKSFTNRKDCLEQDARVRVGGIYIMGGEITEEFLYSYYLSKGYILCNYSPGFLSIHAPDHLGGGGWGEIYGEIADKLGKIYDPHNYKVHQFRAEEKKKGGVKDE